MRQLVAQRVDQAGFLEQALGPGVTQPDTDLTVLVADPVVFGDAVAFGLDLGVAQAEACGEIVRGRGERERREGEARGGGERERRDGEPRGRGERLIVELLPKFRNG